MSWIIASMPFWGIGIFFSIGTIASVTHRYPDETDREVAGQMLLCLALAGIFSLIAAKIAS